MLGKDGYHWYLVPGTVEGGWEGRVSQAEDRIDTS